MSTAQSAEQAAQLAYQQAYQLYQQQAAAQLQQQVGSNQKYKSTLCNIWLMEGVCPRGRLCHYAHGIRELNYSQYYALWGTTPTVTTPVNKPEDHQNKFFKTAICQFWQQKGVCNNGDQCKWAHGDQELRRSENGLGMVRSGLVSDEQTSSVMIGPQLEGPLPKREIIEDDCVNDLLNDRKRNWQEAGLEIADR
uniref:C3H1-type domain-containing protein n=2 Tax=Meloidogyne TaxID=189290 RepID=A0A915NMF4_9BILA